jgi:hypothetical protein
MGEAGVLVFRCTAEGPGGVCDRWVTNAPAGSRVVRIPRAEATSRPTEVVTSCKCGAVYAIRPGLRSRRNVAYLKRVA